ncbi:hypothetical protein LOD99_15979 [Oopsacas minuta]|uniref:Uncharacterized protein n=1 Tax=Oopsacas minuta TaxID=111878 RepID=A0AAV7K7I5_9METZ|nr:hypothetical protein LOD99_15979 [Oopsacas minuta]
MSVPFSEIEKALTILSIRTWYLAEVAEGAKVLELKLDDSQIKDVSTSQLLLNQLIELKSLLNNPSPTSESLVRAEKFAQSCLDSARLEEPPLDSEFILAPSLTDKLVQLANSLYADNTKDETTITLYLLSCVYFIREPNTKSQSQEAVASTTLTTCTELYFSYSEHTTHNLSLILSVLSEFVIHLPTLFTNHGGFDYSPLLLPILEDNTNHKSVCLATMTLLKNAFIFNPNIKQDTNFTSLPNHISTLLQLYPRDLELMKEVFVLLTNFITEQRGLIPQLADTNHPILSFCITTLQDDTCFIDMHFSVCPILGLIVFSLKIEDKTLIARLLLKNLIRARKEKIELPDNVFAATAGVTFSYSVDKLSKDPKDDLASPPSSLTYSEFQDLLGITMASTDGQVVLLQSIGMLSNLAQRNRNMRFSTELLKGLRNAFIVFHRTGDKDTVQFILRLIYGIDKSDRSQAEAMVDSEIASGITECLSQEADLQTVMMFLAIINGIMICYQQQFKDIKQLNDPTFHNTFITLFFRPTTDETKESLHEVLSFCFINLSCDKLSSISMYEHGVIPKMLEFISTPEHYTKTSLRAAISSLANIGIDSTKAKKAMFESGMHLKLSDMIKTISTDTDPDWSLYCTALRGVQILASGDYAKQAMLKTDLKKDVVSILRRDPSVTEVVWRSFTFLAGLSYVAVPDREQFFTKQLFELISSQMRKMKHGKIFGCGCSFFISMSEHDLGVRYTGDFGLDKVIFEAMNKPSLTDEMGDLKRRCLGCLDKFVCHVIPRPLPQPVTNPILPNNIDNFIVHRHFGVTRHFCSNCEQDAPRSEVVMRPDAVTLKQYQQLVNNGWYRRGGRKMFRFNSQHKKVCFDWETRVRVKEFDINSSKTFKRVLKKVPNDVVIETVPARLTQEGVDLYNRYHLDKHDKPAKTANAYAEHAVLSPLKPETRNGINYGTFSSRIQTKWQTNRNTSY